MPPQITQYEHLTEDELLHLATQRVQLSDEARLRLDDELSRRGPGAEQIRTYSDETEVLREAKGRRVRLRSYRGVGTTFYGRSHSSCDPNLRIEEFDTTLWFVFIYFPLIPIRRYRIRRRFRPWWRILASNNFHVLSRLPRDWEQILLTWVKAMALLLGLRFFVPVLFEFLRKHGV
jgi:hypothetical protein